MPADAGRSVLQTFRVGGSFGHPMDEAGFRNQVDQEIVLVAVYWASVIIAIFPEGLCNPHEKD
jgi:hypothetical protein